MKKEKHTNFSRHSGQQDDLLPSALDPESSFIMKSIFIVTLCTLLTACQFIGTIYSVGDKAANILMDDRPFAQDMRDISTNAAVRTELTQCDSKFFLDIEVTVFNDIVLLTGALPAPELIDTAVRATWRVEDVKQVLNYIRLDEPSSYLASQDATLSAKIRWQLSITRGISSANYKITMDDGTVYIMGLTKSDEELSNVISVIRSTVGVTKFIILTTRLENQA